MVVILFRPFLTIVRSLITISMLVPASDAMGEVSGHWSGATVAILANCPVYCVCGTLHDLVWVGFGRGTVNWPLRK